MARSTSPSSSRGTTSRSEPRPTSSTATPTARSSSTGTSSRRTGRPTRRGRTKTDGSTEIVDRDQTQANKVLVAEFVQACLIERRIERIPDFISADRYHQHSAEVPDGLAAFMERFGAEGCPLSYQACELMVGEGNFVAALSRARWGDQPLCQVDLFRVEAGKNVGHWDNSEPVPPEPEWVNSGKF